jgi:hypothetical protein
MYDLDVDGMLEQLQKIPNAELLVSNPCMELWFLLHHQDQKSEISSDRCIKKLQKFSNEYKKGILSEEDKTFLAEKKDLAIERAKNMIGYQNPSSTVYKLLEKLKG